MYKELTKEIEQLLEKLTPQYLEQETWKLLNSSPEVDGGIGGYRLVKHFLNRPDLNDIQTVWAYQKLRPALVKLFDQIPSLYYFTGD